MTHTDAETKAIIRKYCWDIAKSLALTVYYGFSSYAMIWCMVKILIPLITGKLILMPV